MSVWLRRRARQHGGPFDGSEVAVPLPESMPWPRFICHRSPAGSSDWVHYAHRDGSDYDHVGMCADIDHDGAPPHDHDDAYKEWAARREGPAGGVNRWPSSGVR